MGGLKAISEEITFTLRWGWMRRMRTCGELGHCVPGNWNSKCRDPEREKVLARLRNKMVARMECSGGSGRSKGFEGPSKGLGNINNS